MLALENLQISDISPQYKQWTVHDSSLKLYRSSLHVSNMLHQRVWKFVIIYLFVKQLHKNVTADNTSAYVGPVKKVDKTRNTFCGTWYLPHSQDYNDRTVPIIVAGCIAHARNGRISIYGVKFDVTIVFLDPDFLKDAKMSAIHIHLWQI